jgi:hypothetical protein
MRRRDFVKTTTGAIGGAYTLAAGLRADRPLDRELLARLDPGRYDATWWNRQPVRLVQTNLREIDARMDLDAYVDWMADHAVNLVLLNVGGIVANYPTQLEFHYRNPFMEGDLVGDLITRLHERDIRVMGRFDFSKINETLAERRPDWLYVSAEGENINYNGQVHLCPSRGYQQEYSFRILEEAITSYPLDAIFFNMVGYHTRDYTGNDYGQCQCPECRDLFADGSGQTRGEVANELFTRMHGYIRELDPEIVISTYTTVGVDMVSTESASSLSTSHEWNYSGTDHVKRTLDSYVDLVPMNLLIGFLAIGFRHIATSPDIARVWQTQNMLHGGSLNHVFIGPAHEYQDRAFVPTLRELYRFHEANDELFTNLRSAGRVALVRGPTQEYRGLIKLLSEEHVIYDIIAPDVIGTERMPRPLADYDAVILGDIRDMSDELVELIDGYVRDGGKLLATGFSSVRTPGASGGFGGGSAGLSDPASRILLECLGVTPEYEFFPQSHSTYLNIGDADRAAFGPDELRDFDLMMVYEDLLRLRPRTGARGYMNLIPNTMYGPPEKNYFLEDEITDDPGAVYNEHGNGRSLFVPWGLGSQYYAKGHHIHRAFFRGVLRNVLQVERSVETDAPHLVEVSHLINRNGEFEWVGLLNHTGQVGPTLGGQVPIRDITVRLRPASPAREVMLMRSGRSADFREAGDGWIEVSVPELNDFEMVVCLY